MSDWQKDFTEIWEAITQLAEEFNVAILDAVEEFADAVATELELISAEAKEIQEEVFQAGWFDELFTNPEQFFNFLNDSENNDEWPIYYEPRQAATETCHPACVGCCNYNGTTFGGNLLVCGFHPYGWDGDSCPDWEQQ